MENTINLASCKTGDKQVKCRGGKQQAVVESEAGAQVLHEKQLKVTTESQHVVKNMIEITALMKKGKPCLAVDLESMRLTLQ